MPMKIEVLTKALTGYILSQVSNGTLINFHLLCLSTYLLAHTVLVKFGDDPDLPEEQCHMLLRKYMPPHVKTSKVLQRLFVRYL